MQIVYLLPNLLHLLDLIKFELFDILLHEVRYLIAAYFRFCHILKFGFRGLFLLGLVFGNIRLFVGVLLLTLFALAYDYFL